MVELIGYKVQKSISLIDKEILGVLEKFGHATVEQIIALLPKSSKRSLNVIRSRCRMLGKGYKDKDEYIKGYEYIEEFKNGQFKVYRLTATGYQAYASKPLHIANSKVRGFEFLRMDLARILWAIEQAGFVETSGFEHIDNKRDLSMIDALSRAEGEDIRFLIIDSDNTSNYIGETITRILKFYDSVGDRNPTLYVITFFRHRKVEIENLVCKMELNAIVQYSPLDM